MKKSFIITSRGAKDSVRAVVAPKGYHRLSDGSIEKDGTLSFEMGLIQNAYRFNTRRSAALTASAMGFPEIKEINW